MRKDRDTHRGDVLCGCGEGRGKRKTLYNSIIEVSVVSML